MVLVFAAILGATSPQAARAAFTPESPEVKKLVRAGLDFLQKAPPDGRLGALCLVGLCQFKDTGDAENAQVVAALNACRGIDRQKADRVAIDIYSTGIAIFFLCEVDAEKYRSIIQILVDSLVHRQKNEGGWGYPTGGHAATGDTSMTQYALLGLWSAKRNGVKVPREVCEKACDWLIRTQDPSGGWGYQGVDPGNYTRVAQTPVRLALCAAGLGSAYICADLLGFSSPVEEREIEGLPPAFTRVVEKPKDKEGPSKLVSIEMFRRTITDGNRWFARNFALKSEEPWVYYYMYAYERAVSFRELADGRELPGGWYDAGVRFLTKEQKEDGSWVSTAGAVPDTAFALLFLMRGTKKTIEKTVEHFREGTFVGGRGLPSRAKTLQLRNGQISATPLATSIDQMLQILEDPEHADFDFVVESAAELKLDATDPAKRGEQLARLKWLLTESDSPGVRKLVVDALAASGSMEAAPLLIDAIEDESLPVVIAARDGLQRMSRKFSGFGPADRPTREDKAAAAQRWRQWYRTLVPEEE
jgi:hypothetical protein